MMNDKTDVVVRRIRMAPLIARIAKTIGRGKGVTNKSGLVFTNTHDKGMERYYIEDCENTFSVKRSNQVENAA